MPLFCGALSIQGGGLTPNASKIRFGFEIFLIFGHRPEAFHVHENRATRQRLEAGCPQRAF
jgi:hypothetical protein